MSRIAILCLSLICVAWSPALRVAHADTSIITKIETTDRPAEGNQVVLFEFTEAPAAHLVLLRAPDRIALDFDDTLPAIQPEWPTGTGLIESVREGATGPSRYRYIFNTRSPVEAELARRPDDGARQVYALELRATTEASKIVGEASLSPRRETQVASDTRDAARTSTRTPRFTVVIDPGHGGEDDGAIAQNGVLEKDINLQAAFQLRDALQKAGGVRVVLTRETDVFVSLAERTRIGRQEDANLFVSLHADSIRYDELRGATIYTLSERASDRLSLEIANNENAADRHGDTEVGEETPEVVDILSDFTRRETVGYSEHFAGTLLSAMRASGLRMINNPKRSAGFRVLKAPDVPSVLIELGFLSNAEDAKLLADAEWRAKTMGTIANAIVDFYGVGQDD